MTRRTLYILFSVLLGTLLMASSAHAKNTKQAIPEHFLKALKVFKVHSVEPTTIKGIYQARVDNNELIYITEDGRYVLTGNIIDTRNKVNLTEKTIESFRADSVKALAKAQYIAYTPKGGAKYHINVFTDIDCYYCQKLHKEMDNYLEKGIEVRYFFFPRAGVQSPSAQKLVNVWCAKDQQKAMNRAKSGKSNPIKQCKTPMAEHMKLAQGLGVNGTPLIYTQYGSRIGGYAPAKEIYRILKGGELKQKAK